MREKVNLFLDKFIEVKWATISKQHFVNLNYQFTKIGDMFTADINDLPKRSAAKVNYQCDNCLKVKKAEYGKLIKNKTYVNEGKHFCRNCIIRHIRGKSHQQFVQEVFERVGNEYSVLGEYIGTNKPIEMKHNVCGYIWTLQPANFISNSRGRNGTRCPKCAGMLKPTIEEFKERVRSEVGDEYTVLSDVYINTMTPVKIAHNLCGHSYLVTPDNFLIGGKRCPKCAGLLRLDTEGFKHKVFNIVGDEYTVVGEYLNSQTKIEFRHNSEWCSYSKFTMIPNNFTTHGQRCPACFESKGEQGVRKYLEDKELMFKKQFIFEDLVSDLGNPLRFDFAVLDNKAYLICLIEYDGEFHYRKVFDLDTDERLELQKKHDKMKDEYCNKKSNNLIRIPYWELDNIETILEKELNKLTYIN